MAVKFLDNTGLGYFWSKIKAWCNATFAAITHNHASSAVNAMTGYSKPSTGSALATTDTLNEALGKLEVKVDEALTNNDRLENELQNNYVTLNTQQNLTASKTFLNDKMLVFKSSWLRNVSLSNNMQKQVTPIYCQDANADEFGCVLFGRYHYTDTFNTARLRVRTTTNYWVDLCLQVMDNGDYYCTLSAADDTFLHNKGFLGNLNGAVYRKIAVGSYFDVIQTFHPNGNDRIGVLRVGYDSSTKHAIVLGVCNLSNGAPSGLAVVWENGRYIYSQGDLRPGSDNSSYLGAASYRWKQLYASTTTISTSDIRYKDYINKLTNDFLDVWENIEWKQFKFKDAIEEKGSDKARIHTGLIAQEVKTVFENSDLSADKYAFFCYDKWDKIEPTLNEDGSELVQGFEAGDRYSLRYEEALCIEAAYQRRKNKILENRISELERQVSDMLILLQNLTNGNG